VNIGFIGLGRMGGGMAANLAKGGHSLTVFDTFAPATRPFAKRGVAVAASLDELVAGSDVIFTSLPGPVHVEEIVLSPGGIRENARNGSVHVDLSPNSPQRSFA
jgi:3-hydroxyisobutyrate dehydrogenase